MISNKNKILIGIGVGALFIFLIVLILVMNKSSNTSTDNGPGPGPCADGKSKIICSDNSTKCAEDCSGTGGGGSCTDPELLVKCFNNTTQCAPPCDTGTSWVCQDTNTRGSCQTGGTGGTGGTGCCPNSIWNNVARVCVSNSDINGYNIKSCKAGQVPNFDKTKCIDICRTDGMQSEDKCDSDPNSIYYNAVPTTLKGINRTFCYRKFPETKDTSVICYHGPGNVCDSRWNEDDDTSAAIKNLETDGYSINDICQSFDDMSQSPRFDDCKFHLKDNKLSQYNSLTNPDYPVYLYLQEDPKFINSNNTDKATNFQHKPVHCWNTKYADVYNPGYFQFSGNNAHETGTLFNTHIFPEIEKESAFCDGVLNSIIPKL
jgi:hypothetical protein